MAETLQVLIVEDSENDAELLVYYLEKAGYSIVSEIVEDASAFQKALSKRPWDVIFADHQMPRFSSLEALQILKETGLDIPFIIISGTIGEEEAVNALKAGASDYMKKQSLGRLIPAIQREIREARGRGHQRVIEHDLQMTQERYRLVVEASNDGIWDWDIPTGSVYWNDRLFEIVGVPRQSFVTIEFFLSLLHPDDLGFVKEQGRAHLGNKEPYLLEMRLLHSSGQYRHCLVRGKSIRDAQGNAIRMTGLATDITERIQAQEALRKSLTREHLVRKIVEVISQSFEIDVVLEYTAQAICDFFKPDRVLMAIYKYPDREDQRFHMLHQYNCSDSVAAVSVQDIPLEKLREEKSCGQEPHPLLVFNYPSFSDIPAEYRDYAAQYDIKSWLTFEIAYRNIPLGRLILHQCKQSRVWNEDELELLEVLATHLGVALYQSKLYLEEREARQEAEEASHKKDQFLANMSHELRTPLNAIIGFSEMLESGMVELDKAKQKKYIHNISTSGRHLLGMVNDILDISRVEAGQLMMSISWVDLGTLMDDLESVVTEMARRMHLHLKFYKAPDVTRIQGDAVRLRQIFMNLLSNAIKFNRENGSILFSLSWSEDRAWLLVRLEDTGIGIPQDKIPNLFQEFYQVDSSYTRKQEGAGLGLALTKRLVDLHGGTISVESREGEGTVFTVMLPVTQRTKAQFGIERGETPVIVGFPPETSKTKL